MRKFSLCRFRSLDLSYGLVIKAATRIALYCLWCAKYTSTKDVDLVTEKDLLSQIDRLTLKKMTLDMCTVLTWRSVLMMY